MLVDGVAAISPLPGAEAGVVAFRTGGVLHATVITKATFAFAPDAPMPRIEPQPILRAEVHHGDNPARSVRFTSDLVPYLTRADVLFTGHGHATAARLQVHAGERVLVDKTLLLKDSRGAQRMPIVYERAFGGPDVPDNPLGIGGGMDEGEPTILTPGDPRRPAGFGPIARAWPARKRLLGATPRSALEGRIAEIPPGFDAAYFQAAPFDQQTDFLRGDERIVLEGLHPSLPRLVTHLPGLRGAARIHGLAAFGIPDGQPMDLCMDTLRIDGDEQRCTVVCRSWIQLPHENALEAMRVVAGVEVAGEPLAWFDPPRRAANPPPSSGKPAPSPASTLALPPEVNDARPALPFRTGSMSARRSEFAAPPPSPRPPPPPLLSGAPLTPPSALSASNAAADLDTAPEMQVPNPMPKARALPARLFDLLWFDPRSLPRVRRQPAWRAILEALGDKPLDPDIDDPELGLEPAEVEERREMFEVLAHGQALGEEAIREAARAAIRKDGRFVAPLVLVEGDLSFSFDEIESLRARVAATGPVAGGDERTKEALTAARDYLSAADALRDPLAARELGAAIEAAYMQTKKRVVSPVEVTDRIERILLEHRRYQRQAVFGGKHLQCAMKLAGEDRDVPMYIPEALAEVLPMFARFSARILAEAHLAADARASCPLALRGVAIARISATDGW
ncbi:DUF2169 domain-containing protein [Polyangium sp. 6x1]|uniref:DUF2169 family type VI secretion system accessory protein n=1 Tax=Polyangium sp. 6x1 TaxID=3042689 RepID=UPI002482FB1A|nr:DUF2169 domain-containing protein [Polyangium sp. 6x1]MDI1450235.1 DUF2169 domain-containing protein [Polyangium sp. 6x1]